MNGLDSIKAVLLAGGLGSRLSEETEKRPKPMVEVGGEPILMHIMRIYAHFGINDFVVACGYKGWVIKEFFNNFALHESDLVYQLREGKREFRNVSIPDWQVAAVDTGMDVMTGGRLLRLRDKGYLGKEIFMVTYGDGLADIDISALMAFHKQQGRLVTVTAVHPPSRFGLLGLDGDRVASFTEKPQTEEGWINGGFFVFEPAALDYIDGDETSLEKEPLERLAADNQLSAYRHEGFWQPMDTLREKRLLETLWQNGKAPWRWR